MQKQKRTRKNEKQMDHVESTYVTKRKTEARKKRKKVGGKLKSKRE